jgi:flagellar hook-basal body complex protein FliE
MNAAMSSLSGISSTLTNLQGTGAASSTSFIGNPAKTLGETQASPFADLFTDAVAQVGQLQDQAHTAVSGLLNGSGVDVHQAMIATQKADMAFELALSVRNKAVQAYQTVVGMQF